MGEPGHNGPDRESYLKFQAQALIYAEKKALLQAEINRHRKQAKAAGIELGDLDFTIKALGWTVGEIAEHFRRRLSYLGFNNINVKGVDVLGTQTEDQRYAGTLAAMQGKACSPPANLTGNEQGTWIEGWHEGNKARDGALFDMKEAEERAAAATAAAPVVADESTVAAQEVGGADYGDGEAEAADEPTVNGAPEVEEDDGRPPHQPVKRTPKKPEAVR